jgi:hypothetical protein
MYLVQVVPTRYRTVRTVHKNTVEKSGSSNKEEGEKKKKKKYHHSST